MHPLQKECDPEDPKQFAAWVFAAGIPDVGVRAGTYIPNLIHPQLTEGISEMLWEFGFRHHADKQRKWIEGGAGLGTVAKIVDYEPEDWIYKAAEKFLDENNPDLAQTVREAAKKATPEQREGLLRELHKNFEQLRQMIDVLEEGGE